MELRRPRTTSAGGRRRTGRRASAAGPRRRRSATSRAAPRRPSPRTGCRRAPPRRRRRPRATHSTSSSTLVGGRVDEAEKRPVPARPRDPGDVARLVRDGVEAGLEDERAGGGRHRRLRPERPGLRTSGGRGPEQEEHGSAPDARGRSRREPMGAQYSTAPSPPSSEEPRRWGGCARCGGPAGLAAGRPGAQLERRGRLRRAPSSARGL